MKVTQDTRNHPRPRRHRTRLAGGEGRTARAAWMLALCAALMAAEVGRAAPRDLRPPRDPRQIAQALGASPHAGDCEQCHTTHGEETGLVYPNALASPNDNALCARCHNAPWSGGSLAGDYLYRGTGHGSNTRMVWPGPVPPQRVELDAPTKCLNCHDPHGWTDDQGMIPRLGLQREEALCLTCHDGSPSTTDIASEVRKPFRHPVTDYSGRHTGPLESQPADFGITPLNRRHSECEDCHNPHVSRAASGLLAPGNDASTLTLGVSRVLVQNGAAGTPPIYTFVPGSDSLTTPNAEYQLCFKCHSSWTTQPTGQTDFGMVLNPANPSYHPVEEMGRDLSISPLSFAPGWGSSSLTRCGDCHGSDFGSTLGPHGSAYPDILRRPYTAAPQRRQMSSNEICFLCHSYDVYGNPGSPASVQAASRFNAPGIEMGHARHVGDQQVPCYSCHVTHGSTMLPHLLVIGRSPGLQNWTPTATGGTCTPTCHGQESYQSNYAF